MSKFCTACALHKEVIREVYGEGKLTARIMVIGEAPGRDEDKVGRPFIGVSGRLLREALEPILDECYITNMVKCFPHGTPNKKAISTCVNLHIPNQIRMIKPESIILVGGIAKKNFPTNISTATIYTIYHPAYSIRGYMPRDKYKEHVATVLQPLFEKYKRELTITKYE